MNEFQLKYGTNPNQKPARILWQTVLIFPLLF